jgi:hypothetical protein
MGLISKDDEDLDLVFPFYFMSIRGCLASRLGEDTIVEEWEYVER